MILEEIAAKTRERVEKAKKEISLEEVKAQAEYMNADTGFPFYQALAKEHLSYICEVKKASPSKGLIAPDFPYVQIAKEYEQAGASAISCLTEPYYFQGSDRYLREIAKEVSIPVLRKDFVVDEYMIYEAKVLGASAILLICAILNKETVKEYIRIARRLGLSALVEAHDAKEIADAVYAGAEIIGVNNRDLRDFTVDVHNSTRYRAMIPENILFVSESGIQTNADIEVLKQNGTNAVLIGETLMRSSDKKAMLEKLNGEPLK
ncbi:MAG: indole-3-glycerol phosphate synthase TrpC [Lachnospiraceae bacterium]|nr:indole-3-glycerol phosphate synthase TrpC [Lachnospiraceae bacterium]